MGAFCHAAQNTNHKLFPIFLALLKFAEATQHFLFTKATHGTGVEQHNIGFLGTIYQLVTSFPKLAFHQFRIKDIHLAAKGFEKYPTALVGVVKHG
jgi:hypothetical protein